MFDEPKITNKLHLYKKLKNLKKDKIITDLAFNILAPFANGLNEYNIYLDMFNIWYIKFRIYNKNTHVEGLIEYDKVSLFEFGMLPKYFTNLEFNSELAFETSKEIFAMFERVNKTLK